MPCSPVPGRRRYETKSPSSNLPGNGADFVSNARSEESNLANRTHAAAHSPPSGAAAPPKAQESICLRGAPRWQPLSQSGPICQVRQPNPMERYLHFNAVDDTLRASSRKPRKQLASRVAHDALAAGPPPHVGRGASQQRAGLRGDEHEVLHGEEARGRPSSKAWTPPSNKGPTH